MDPFEGRGPVFGCPQGGVIGPRCVIGIAAWFVPIALIPRGSVVIPPGIYVMMPTPVMPSEPKELAAFVISMVLEPRVLARSAKVTSEFLRLAQPAETRGPMKVDNTKTARACARRVTLPSPMHERAISTGIRCRWHRRQCQTGGRQSHQKAARGIRPSQRTLPPSAARW